MKKPKPTPADYKKREELERKDFAGVEHNEFMAAFDWETELFEKDGKYGLRTALGEEIVPPAFEDFRLLRPAELEHGDRVVTQHNGKWGVINVPKNEFLIAPDCEKVHGEKGFLFINGIGSYKKDGKTGIIKSDGAFTEPIFEDFEIDMNEWVKVKYNYLSL